MKKLNKTQFAVNGTLSLRLLTLEDADELFALVDSNREYLKQWLNWLDYNQNIDDSRQFIRTTVCDYMEGRACTFGIFQGNGLIGTCCVIEGNKELNIGYWLAEIYQGSGIVTICAKYLTELALTEMGAHRVIIRCALGNTKSQAVPERLGYTKEGIARSLEFLNGEYIDLVVYSFTKKDLESQQNQG